MLSFNAAENDFFSLEIALRRSPGHSLSEHLISQHLPKACNCFHLSTYFTSASPDRESVPSGRKLCPRCSERYLRLPLEGIPTQLHASGARHFGGISPEAGMNYKAPDPTIPHGGRWLCLDSNTPFLCAALTSLHFPSSPGDVCRSGSNIYHCVRLYAEPLQPTQPRPTGASLNIPSRAAQTRSLTHAPHQPGGPTSAHSYLCVLRCRAPASAQSPAGLHDPACHPLPRAVPPHSGAPALTDHLLQLVIVPVDGPGQGARVLGHDGS